MIPPPITTHCACCGTVLRRLPCARRSARSARCMMLPAGSVGSVLSCSAQLQRELLHVSMARPRRFLATRAQLQTARQRFFRAAFASVLQAASPRTINQFSIAPPYLEGFEGISCLIQLSVTPSHRALRQEATVRRAARASDSGSQVALQ